MATARDRTTDTARRSTDTGDHMRIQVSETYDLSTKVNKMGIVGIHTPKGNLVDQMYPGLIMQYRKFRFVKCDVAMACASMLPADPLQIGVEAGAIAPQDMFNPILYRAVSNDGMSNFLKYIQSTLGTDLDDDSSVVAKNDSEFASGATSETIDQFDMYYGLLADTNGWRKAMPQSGLVMRNLRPIVYQMVSQYGENQALQGTLGYSDINAIGTAINAPRENDDNIDSLSDHVMRGPPCAMPAINTTFSVSRGQAEGEVAVGWNFPQAQAYIRSNVGHVPPAYVALMILPPAKLNQLYYRLKITWTIEFTGFRSLNEIGTWGFLRYVGQASYGTDYAEQSTAMSSITNMVDAQGADLTKIMEGS